MEVEKSVKLGFPHMGYLSAPVVHMLNTLGVDFVTPPPISKKTVELGSSHSPEGVCLPYKITLGNYLECADQGADMFISVCGAGKCRFGMYHAVQRLAIGERYQANFYSINTEKLLPDLYRLLRNIAPSTHYPALIKSISLTLKKLQAIDTLNTAKNFYGARSSVPAKIIDIYAYGAGEIACCETFSEINSTCKIINEVIQSYYDPTAPDPPKVTLIGEFYVLLEPYVNHWIENTLISQGVEVKRLISTGDWAFSKGVLQIFGLYNEEKDHLRQAKPYMHYHVGGEGLKSVGTALWSARQNFDGIIHILPFGCMPEVVAQYALKNVAADYDIPLLTLSVDEHSSDVGITTRIEAFIDCIKRKKQSSGH
jgi:predicted nucleotide-binding protein (sugar kinase/HSP70/actin superfamily)